MATAFKYTVELVVALLRANQENGFVVLFTDQVVWLVLGIFALANRIGTSFAPVWTILHAWTIVDTHRAGVITIDNTIGIRAT